MMVRRGHAIPASLRFRQDRATVIHATVTRATVTRATVTRAISIRLQHLLMGLAMFASWLNGSTCLRADDFLGASLKQAILAKQQTLQESLAFAERRMPVMAIPEQRTDWEQASERLRRALLEKVVLRGEAAAWQKAECRVEYLETIPRESDGYRLKKLRYEALPGLWIPAILYEPWSIDSESISGERANRKVPVVLNVNGHDPLGKAAVYKQIRCINLAKRGMLALNVEWLGMGQLRTPGFAHGRMNQLDLCGTSGLAPFYLAMERALDVVLKHPCADPNRVAVAGLSGGGWQTIWISALDRRVTLSNPVAGYSSLVTRIHHRSDLGDSEQTPTDFATVADYTHLTAMRAPRPTLLTYNAKDDCCFGSSHALPPLVSAADPVFKLFGKSDHLRTHINHDPGNHNFERDNREAFYRMLADHFAESGKELSTTEIECQNEVLTAEQLHVALPEPQVDFSSLAKKLAADLPRPEATRERQALSPKSGAEGESDRSTPMSLRERLRSVAGMHEYEVAAEKTGEQTEQGLQAKFWKLRVGGEWNVPVVEFARGNPQSTAMLFADSGRASLAARVRESLDAGQRVLVLDPFYFGECRIEERDYLIALLIATVGERPLGVQASQLNAVADWARHQFNAPLQLITEGPRSGLIGLVARAAANPHSNFRDHAMHSGPVSLKQVFDENLAFEQRPEWFCFGLLEWVDVPQLKRLADGSPVVRD
jgi:hypothetical protein